MCVCLVLSRYPQQHVTIVASGSQNLALCMLACVVQSGLPHCTSWAPSYDVHSLRVLDECGKIGYLAVFSVAVNLPELYTSQQPHMTSNSAKHVLARCYHRQLSPVVPCRGARSGLSRWVRSRCARTPAAVQPSFWMCVRLGAVRSTDVWMTVGFVQVSAAREPSAELMRRPQPRGAVLGVRAVVRRTGKRFVLFTSVTANVCWL